MQPNPDPNAAAVAAGGSICMFMWCGFILLFAGVMIVSLWKVFEKAGRPGWEAIVPFYNAYVLTCEIAGMEVLWFILQFIPLANIAAAFMVSMEVARKFGKSEGFGIGLALLGFIFFPILAFGDAEYEGRRRKKKRRPVYDDDEEDDRPRRRDDDEDDYDDRPRRRRDRD